MRSLHMKLVMMLVLLIISVMAVVGTFIISSVSSFYTNDFADQMVSVFSPELYSQLEQKAGEPDAAFKIMETCKAYGTSLGLSNARNMFVLDKDGNFLIGTSTKDIAVERTPNIISAINGQVGQKVGMTQEYMDIALPISDDQGNVCYIVYIKDSKLHQKNLTQTLFNIILQGVLFGLIVSVLLSFLLSKTMTTPIEDLTSGAKLVAEGQFDHKLEVHSRDEIGMLTQTFNNMAKVLKLTIEEVENEKNKLNTLFLHMADGVCAFYKDGKILHMNPAAQNLLGVDFDDQITYDRLFEKTPVSKKQVLALGSSGYIENQFETGDKNLQVLFAHFGNEGDADSGILALIRDVTEQHKLEIMRREFLANVSHELRTPLTNIKSYTETLMDSPDIDQTTQHNFLGVISNEADRMTRLVKDLLTLSKIDNAKMDWKMSRFSLEKLLTRAYLAMVMEAKNNDHEFLIDLPENLPDFYGDMERIEQVIINIVANALKYTPEGGRIVLSARSTPEKIIIKVTDNGVGIPKADLPRLFERFYRVDKARSREKGGTGLGLSIAQDIVHHHKGKIYVESSTNKGTVMTIELPPGEKSE